MNDKDLQFRIKTKQHYDSLAPFYEKLRDPYGARRRRDAAISFCERQEAGFVLDGGSADGMMSAPLLELGWSVTMVDISGRLLELARAQGISVIVGDMESLPLRDHTFDLVICTEVFEHLANYQHAAGEIGRVTKSGGGAIISIPNPIWELLFKIADTLKMKVPEKTKRLVTRGRAASAMRQSGFRMLEQRGVILWPLARPQLITRLSLRMESKFPWLCATLISMYRKR